MKAGIQAIEYYLPKKILSNDELSQLYVSWSSQKIFDKTGIATRHIASDNEYVSDLAQNAAMKLFANNPRITPNSIDFIILVTESPDYKLPPTACILQDRLGIPTSAGALDINLGCSGYIYALKLAKALVVSGETSKVLLLTGDLYSKFIHPMDKSTRTLFGDAATASVITSDNGVSPIGKFNIGTNGAGFNNFIIPAGGTLQPCTTETAVPNTDTSGNVRSKDNIYMNGQEIMLFTMEAVPKSVKELLCMEGLDIEDINWFIFHQANRFILEYLRKKLAIPSEKFIFCMEDVGNTVSSSIPIALKRISDGSKCFKKGDKILLTGFGVGMSWGTTIIEFGGKL